MRSLMEKVVNLGEEIRDNMHIKKATQMSLEGKGYNEIVDYLKDVGFTVKEHNINLDLNSCTRNTLVKVLRGDREVSSFQYSYRIHDARELRRNMVR